MRSTNALVVTCALIGMSLGCSRTPSITLDKQNSFPDCPVIPNVRDDPLRDSVAKFFLAEVRADVTDVRMRLGSQCGSETLYAVSVDDPRFRAPFLIRVDNKSGKMVLMRPQ